MPSVSRTIPFSKARIVGEDWPAWRRWRPISAGGRAAGERAGGTGMVAAALPQNTGCPLIRLGSQVENDGKYVTILIALKIAR